MPMTAKIFALSREVREAALDARAVHRRVREAGSRAHEWAPAHANACARMVAISLEQGSDPERLPCQPEQRPGKAPLKLAKA
jgi:hypothetical protein